MNGGVVLFDFDGTLADTAGDMVEALNRYLADDGVPGVGREAALGCVSGGARALLRLGGVEEARVEDARDVFLRYYEATGYRRSRLFDGVEGMFASLNESGAEWGVVTNKPRRYFEPIAAAMQLRERGAKVMLCGDDLPKAKPHPDGLLAAADACGMPPGRCLYVGDDWRDAAAAKAAGMAFVAAAWGYFRHSREWEQWESLPVAAIAALPSVLPLLSRATLENRLLR